MKILAVNAGSSTLKWKLFEMPQKTVIARGQVERIGLSGAKETTIFGSQKIDEEFECANHLQAVERLLSLLTESKIVTDLNEIKGIGHRFVNGGTVFARSTVINDAVLQEMEKLKILAPLHNPANIMAIKAFRAELPQALSVAVFDTGFHQTMPRENLLYGIPYEYYQKYHVQKFGAHGISYRFILKELLRLSHAEKSKTNAILLHLGSGASVCAVKEGFSLDTSMGFSPVSGIMMQTRSGDVDPSLLLYLEDQLGISTTEILKILNEKSGILGVSGISPDMREVFAQRHENPRAQLAISLFVNRIVKYIGAYAAELGRVDALAFAGGIGENIPVIRKLICEQLEILGIKIAATLNDETKASTALISTADSKVEVWVIPTNEELMIAEDVYKLAEKE
ncbi:acetate/propionate family kinase [Liquorilactobacillus satsumensis]|uniref:Acetate kinase n=1 Tax=Liquorilactobacillus satsumensis DSM 16230 = JCM 12392 TaxID=1423801 RepID=A0A0R1V4I1_9LACO|nr:acetate kinase [Liquorilactobacillus satsumensis]KRM00546.1 acetate kinase [Liquorilactobacillus satsumensis DSM 16230 = JCM 12392]MCC7667401.1 acetate kinase [Liquorilactobacillus satsumensis]MCP9313260.1 acetate kinase [Liquorilactobacillus satsumensis]MCP9329512.1 acetate kinase [Liquorilactobacillus satsumensis]MCP9358617.1 acetate kinase [Liquorilactobacillus satsumensis]